MSLASVEAGRNAQLEGPGLLAREEVATGPAASVGRVRAVDNAAVEVAVRAVGNAVLVVVHSVDVCAR